MTRALTYAVVTPARNEAENLKRLAGALAAQTRKPKVWAVVEDGSTDGTWGLLTELAMGHDWLLPVTPPAKAQDELARGRRGGRALEGFRTGVRALRGRVDVVIKVDADVDFDADYCERLLDQFAADPKLGIASGTCYEREGGEWVRRTKANTTVWGASRAYRWDCLPDVMDLEPRMGWDGLDELSVQLRGLRTETFVDLPFRHHRPEGGREHSGLHHGEALGRASWYMGYRPTYITMRALYRARSEPRALAMIWGYGAAALRREPRCPDVRLVGALRERQRLRAALRRGAPES
jgi:glycosyltransferase involved in cell wall biosynthesis